MVEVNGIKEIKAEISIGLFPNKENFPEDTYSITKKFLRFIARNFLIKICVNLCNRAASLRYVFHPFKNLKVNFLGDV